MLTCFESDQKIAKWTLNFVQKIIPIQAASALPQQEQCRNRLINNALNPQEEIPNLKATLDSGSKNYMSRKLLRIQEEVMSSFGGVSLMNISCNTESSKKCLKRRLEADPAWDHEFRGKSPLTRLRNNENRNEGDFWTDCKKHRSRIEVEKENFIAYQKKLLNPPVDNQANTPFNPTKRPLKTSLLLMNMSSEEKNSETSIDSCLKKCDPFNEFLSTCIRKVPRIESEKKKFLEKIESEKHSELRQKARDQREYILKIDDEGNS